MTKALTNGELGRKEVIIGTAVSGWGIPLTVIGLVTILVLLAACGPAATPTPTAPMPEPGPEWDYVVLGDSVTFGFPNYYAAHIEADLGVKVTVHMWSRGNLRTTKLLEMLRNDEDLRSDISEAEVVTFHIPAGAIGDALRSYRDGTCGGTDNQDCFREAVRLLKADIDAIITEILSLTSTSDTIIRAMEFYNPGVNEWKGLGIFEELNPYHAAHNEYLLQACSEHNIPVARVYLAFNGPNGDEDPNDKGYMRWDGIHPNEVGRAVIADLHREVGYEPLRP